MPRSYSKKRQTRLSFAPVSSSTGNPENHSHDRLANLRYDHPSRPRIRQTHVAAAFTASPARSEQKSVSPGPSVDAHSPRDEDIPKATTSAHLTSAITESSGDEMSSDLEIVIPSSARRGLRNRQLPAKRHASDEEDPINSSVRKRKKVQISPQRAHSQTPRRRSIQENLDLEEDLEDLQDSVVKTERTRGVLATSAKAQRQRVLEALRRRRAGEKAPSTDEESKVNSESSEGEVDDDVGEDDDDDDDERVTGTLGRGDDSDADSFVASESDLEDFVLEDEGNALGVPTDEMPLEFTRHRYKKPKEYFQDVVEWMVHNKINPAFPRSDPLYQTAFMKLDDEVKGRASSQLVSAAWNRRFHRALHARPQIEVTPIPASEGHACDACSRSGHPATSELKLYGKPYSLETLDPLSDDSEDEERDAESETGERDRDGHLLPDEKTRWLLGRFCKAKATMAHTLIHWRFHLNEWVLDHLARQGVLDDDQIIERSRWSQKRQTKYANSVVDMMRDSNEIEKLYRDFHINLKAAREIKEPRY